MAEQPVQASSNGVHSLISVYSPAGIQLHIGLRMADGQLWRRTACGYTVASADDTISVDELGTLVTTGVCQACLNRKDSLIRRLHRVNIGERRLVSLFNKKKPKTAKARPKPVAHYASV